VESTDTVFGVQGRQVDRADGPRNGSTVPAP
jgi:hypothetical protein